MYQVDDKGFFGKFGGAYVKGTERSVYKALCPKNG